MWKYVEKANSLCKRLIIHNLEKRIADFYSKMEIAKEIQDTLKKQYNDDESIAKIHIINKFKDYKFEKDKPMLSQVKDLLQISQMMVEDEKKLSK